MTAGVGLKLGKPIFTFNMGVDKPLLDIRSNLSNCTVLLAYTSYKDQVLEILQFLEKQGGYAKQVITS